MEIKNIFSEKTLNLKTKVVMFSGIS